MNLLIRAPFTDQMYSQHPVVPAKELLHRVTHVALAFMGSGTFNADETPAEWPLFTTVSDTRAKFHRGTAIQVAIGGWGDTAGFEIAASSEANRKRFARNVAAMVQATGADGWSFSNNYERLSNTICL